MPAHIIVYRRFVATAVALVPFLNVACGTHVINDSRIAIVQLCTLDTFVLHDAFTILTPFFTSGIEIFFF